MATVAAILVVVVTVLAIFVLLLLIELRLCVRQREAAEFDRDAALKALAAEKSVVEFVTEIAQHQYDRAETFKAAGVMTPTWRQRVGSA